MITFKFWRFLVLALGLTLAACATSPPQRPPLAIDSVAKSAAETAQSMVGKPYKYGGTTPAGFDCSGLVQYSYRKVGIKLPRATSALFTATFAVRSRDLRRGDLLFFNEDGEKNSHVGIFLGDGRFVHSPASGGVVRIEKLDSDHWKKTFSEAHRV